MTMQTLLNKNQLTEVGLRLALRRIGSTVWAGQLLSARTIRICLEDCARYIHADNRERGWWTDLQTGEPLQRNVGEMLMLMVSEIGEMPGPSGAIFTTLDDKLPNRLMFEVELADCAIRIFDTAGALCPNMWTGYVAGCAAEGSPYASKSGIVSDYLLAIVRHLSLAMEAHRKNVVDDHGARLDYWLGRALHSVFLMGRIFSVDVASAIAEKLVFNANRADHKLENRRASGGKAY